MRHAALGGGKRLRPLFVCAACTDLGGALEDALPRPAPLNSCTPIRWCTTTCRPWTMTPCGTGCRAVTSATVKQPPSWAGDALQALAFETLAQAPGADPQLRLAAVQRLGSACGWGGLVGGSPSIWPLRANYCICANCANCTRPRPAPDPIGSTTRCAVRQGGRRAPASRQRVRGPHRARLSSHRRCPGCHPIDRGSGQTGRLRPARAQEYLLLR